MERKTWKERLNDRRWQKRRNEILERDNYKCTNTACKSGPNTPLHVHHRDYYSNNDPWDYPDCLLDTLCETCHKAEMDRNQLETYLAYILKDKGFLVSDLYALGLKIGSDIEFTKSLLKVLRDFQNG